MDSKHRMNQLEKTRTHTGLSTGLQRKAYGSSCCCRLTPEETGAGKRANCPKLRLQPPLTTPLYHPGNARMQEKDSTEQKRHDPTIKQVQTWHDFRQLV